MSIAAQSIEAGRAMLSELADYAAEFNSAFTRYER